MSSKYVFPYYRYPQSDVGATGGREYQSRNAGKVFALIRQPRENSSWSIALRKRKGGIQQWVSDYVYDPNILRMNTGTHNVGIAGLVDVLGEDLGLGDDLRNLYSHRFSDHALLELQTYLKVMLEGRAGVAIGADGPIESGTLYSKFTTVGFRQILDRVQHGQPLVQGTGIVSEFGAIDGLRLRRRGGAGITMSEDDCASWESAIDFADFRQLLREDLIARNTGKQIRIGPPGLSSNEKIEDDPSIRPVTAVAVQGGVTVDIRSHAQLFLGSSMGIGVANPNQTAYDLGSDDGHRRLVTAVARELGGLADPRFGVVVKTHLHDSEVLKTGITIDAEPLTRRIADGCYPDTPQLARYFKPGIALDSSPTVER